MKSRRKKIHGEKFSIQKRESPIKKKAKQTGNFLSKKGKKEGWGKGKND
jgi:hypothetical protein